MDYVYTGYTGVKGLRIFCGDRKACRGSVITVRFRDESSSDGRITGSADRVCFPDGREGFIVSHRMDIARSGARRIGMFSEAVYMNKTCFTV